MNLIQFLKKVDTTVSAMTKEQLQSCIHELARTLSESEMYHFLDVIGMVQGNSIASILKEKSYCDEMNSEIKAIKEILAHINDGERCLDSEYNEEWDGEKVFLVSQYRTNQRKLYLPLDAILL